MLKLFKSLLILGICLSASLIYGQNSTHKIHKELFGEKYKSADNIRSISPLVKNSNKSLTHSVFGYLPYWENINYQYINYNLLTHIALFDFGVDEKGELLFPANIFESSWNSVINNAHSFNVKVLMTASNFDSLQIDKIINEEISRNNFISNVKETISNNNLDGIIVDFEAPKIKDRGEAMNSFMNLLTSEIKSDNPEYEVAFSSPAVNWGGYWKLKGLAESCDYLFLMGYDYYGNWSNNTGPTSPLKGGTQNLTHSLDSHYSEVVNLYPEKLILGIPYYGLHFKSENGDIGSEKIDTVASPRYRESVDIYQQHGLFWASEFEVPYSYWQQGSIWNQYIVDNDSSLSLKYDLAIQRNLKGVGIWALGYDGSREELWDLLAQKFERTVSAESIEENLSEDFTLLQNYPNPFNPSTNIQFFTGGPAEVSIKIYDILGRTIRGFIFNAAHAGTHTITWNGTDINNTKISSGTYFLRATYRNEKGRYVSSTKKMTLAK